MDAEMIFWAVALVVVLVAVRVMWHLGKKEEENYIDWMRDWE